MSLDIHPFEFIKGDVGCLMIHGATGSPAEMRPMGEYLAERDITIVGFNLPGHGTKPEDLASIEWMDLVNAAEMGLERAASICKEVFICGLSLGGLLSLYLTTRHTVPGVIVMGAPAYFRDWRMPFLPILSRFVKFVQSPDVMDLTDPKATDRLFYYDKMPVSFGIEALALLKTVQKDLSKVDAPILIMQGECDRTIPPDSAEILFERVSSQDKNLVMIPNSGHAITVDTERIQVWETAYQFIRQHTNFLS